MGLGAVLTQKIDGVEKVNSYASRTFTDREKSFFTTELECLAVIWNVEKFRLYLEGTKFQVITDHSALLWLHNLKNPSGRLARWAIKLLSYDIEIIHRKGRFHHLPDALSRMYEDSVENLNCLNYQEDPWYVNRHNDILREPKKFHDWKVVGDKIFHKVPDSLRSSITGEEHEWKYVIPLPNRPRILAESHDQISPFRNREDLRQNLQ